MDKELWQPTLHWLLTSGLRVLAILLGTFLGIKLLRYLVQRIKQWDVARELRKRIKKIFEEKNIEMPYPHQVHLTKIEGPVKMVE